MMRKIKLRIPGLSGNREGRIKRLKEDGLIAVIDTEVGIAEMFTSKAKRYHELNPDRFAYLVGVGKELTPWKEIPGAGESWANTLLIKRIK